ncbi:MAG TPA: AsmA family protein [Burkholderiales bacterium]|nr:AsmA family protein [Burkholderiales bacterium]
MLTLDAQRSKIHFINEGIDFEIVAQTTPIDVNAKPSPVDEVLVNNLNVDGTYQGVRFNGSALIGNFMSFRESREWFPLRGHLSAGKTRLDIDGRLADIFDLGPVDAQMRLAGDSFAHLHPFLKFKPPVSRPYALEAKVWQDDGKYSFTELKGKVGGADIAGEATYDRKSARPVTTAALHSNSANLLDLVFLAGMDYRTLDSASNQDSAGKGNAQIFSDRVLNLEPMRKFDAHIKLDVKKLRVAKMPIDSLQLNANLVDGALQVSPLDLGAAGGHLVGSFDFNANEQPPVVSTRLDGRNLRLERIVSPGRSETTSEGGVRAQLRASGRGKSLAAIAGSATGTLAALVDGGNISNLVDAKLALNLGKVIGLRIRGDRPIPLHCGAAAFDFRDGIGKSQALLLETEQTHTDGAGTIDLRAQSYELLLTPQPKKPGIFTLNSSIRVSGAFKNADVKIEERVPLRQNGRTAPPATVASLFKPLLDKRGDSACAQMLAPVKMVASAG